MELISILRKLYVTNGEMEYYGEDVTQLQHASQTYQLAKKAGADMELRVAAFLHDIGHLLSETQCEVGAENHDKIGGEWLLKNGFTRRQVDVVEHHVNAKKYLCKKYPDYYSKLSNASKITLEMQGGVMSLEQISEFEKLPNFKDIINVRLWDEKAKNKNASPLDLDIIFKEIEYLIKLKHV